MCYNEKNSTEYALVAQLDSVSASDAEGCGFDPRRVHQSPPCGGFCFRRGENPHGFARREEECLPQNHSDEAAHEALCRSIPGGHTKKTDSVRLFLCVSAAVRSSTEGTPSGCRLTLKVAGSPDARRNACPKIIPTMRRTRLYAEVSPHKKQSPSLSFFILQCLKKKLYAATAYIICNFE